MFSSASRPKLKRGRPITGREIVTSVNAPDRLLTQIARIRGGRGTLWAPFGPQFAQPGTGFRIGITGSDGIPAAMTPEGESSGTVQLGYSSDIQDCWVQVQQPGQAVLMVSDSSANFDGYNLSSSPVSAQAITIYMMLWSVWICIWEDCPSSSS
jgi:hypothetical protein